MTKKDYYNQGLDLRRASSYFKWSLSLNDLRIEVLSHSAYDETF